MTHYSTLIYSLISRIFKAACLYLSTLILAATYTWSSFALGQHCVCEVKTDDCVQCCGNKTAGHKYCQANTPPPIGPSVVMRAPASTSEVDKWDAKEPSTTTNDNLPHKIKNKDQNKPLDNSIKGKP